MEVRASSLGVKGEQAWIGAVKINITPLLRDRCEIAKVCHNDFQRHLASPLRCEIFRRNQTKISSVTGQFAFLFFL